MIYFIWDAKNADHIGEHNVTREEAEYVVGYPAPGYPRYQGDNKLLARGQTEAGRYIQVIYVLAEDAAEIEYAEVDLIAMEMASALARVIHARDLDASEKRALNRKGKGR